MKLQKLKILILTIHIVAGSALFAQTDFSPAKYVSADYSAYIETSSYSKLTEALKSFYIKLRGKTAEQEIQILATSMLQEFGINPLDMDSLSKIGFNTQAAIGFAAYTSIPLTPDEKTAPLSGDIVFIVPATDSSLLITSLTDIIKKLEPESIITETLPGKIWSVKGGDEIFIGKGENFVVFSNSNSRIQTTISPITNNLLSANEYMQMKKKTETFSKEQNRMIFYMFSPKDVANFSTSIMNEMMKIPGMENSANPAHNQLMTETNENLASAGGTIDVSALFTRLHIMYVYKDGYLQDKTKLIPSILIDDAKNLTVDQLNVAPVFYFTFKMNIAKLVQLVTIMAPEFTESFAQGKQLFKLETGLDLEEDLFAAFTGKFSMNLTGIPDEKNISNLEAWPGFISMGIDKNKRKVFETIFNMFKQKMATDKSKAINIKKFGQGTLYEFVNTKEVRKLDTKNSKKGKRVYKTEIKKDKLYILLASDEITITSNELNLKQLAKKDSKTVAQRFINLSAEEEKRSNALVYINMTSLVKYVNSSSFKMLAAPFIGFFENIEGVSMTSSTHENTADSMIEIRLKK